MKTKENYLELNGSRLYYQVNGSGKDIIFIHGFSLDQRMWSEQIKSLSKKYRVISYDVRGFGQSAISASSPSSNIEDLLAILNACQSEQATIVGHSMGAVIASDFAISYPQRTNSLILNAWMGSETFSRVMTIPSLAVLLQEMVSNYSGWHWKNQVSVSAGCSEKGASKEIEKPSLIIVGENDSQDYKNCAQELHKNITCSELITIQDSGHFSNMEQAELFNQLIINFLENS